MKKQYETPMADVIEFNYREQVVASGFIPGGKCNGGTTTTQNGIGCTDVTTEIWGTA